MKKLIAISLIALFIFNLFGYRLLFNFAQQQSDLQLEASLDKADYNEADLIALKIPITVPYQTTQSGFERVDGEVKVGGVLYKYVKRKIVDGQLVLLCLPNNDKMKLQSARDDFFKYTNDLVQNNHSKKSDHSRSSFKNVISDFISIENIYTTAIPVLLKKQDSSLQLNILTSLPHTSPEQPPEFI